MRNCCEKNACQMLVPHFREKLEDTYFFKMTICLMVYLTGYVFLRRVLCSEIIVFVVPHISTQESYDKDFLRPNQDGRFVRGWIRPWQEPTKKTSFQVLPISSTAV